MKLDSLRRDTNTILDLAESSTLNEAEGTQNGDITTVRKLSDWISVYNKELRKHVDAKNIREARKSMFEIQSAVEQMNENLQAIAKQMGLPDLE
jgi:glutamate synthase domain-containing protein 1